MTLFTIHLELGPETRTMIERVASNAVMQLEFGPMTREAIKGALSKGPKKSERVEGLLRKGAEVAGVK